MESSVSSNFLNLLRHQINDAKMTELYDKNLGSIMIEKSHKVIAVILIFIKEGVKLKIKCY